MLESASTEFLSQLQLEVRRRWGDPAAQLLAPIDLLVARQPDALARQLFLLFDGIKARGLTDNSGAAATDARAAARALLGQSRRTPVTAGR